jgi:hypothetical protein
MRTWPLAAVLVLCGPARADEAAAVKAVTDLGGRVKADEPGGPVTEVELGSSRVADADLKALGSFKHLHTLGLHYTRVSDTGLKELKAFKSLRTLCRARRCPFSRTRVQWRMP